MIKNNIEQDRSNLLIIFAHAIVVGILLGPIAFAIASWFSSILKPIWLYLLFAALEIVFTVLFLRKRNDKSVKNTKMIADFIWNAWAGLTVLSALIKNQDPTIGISDPYQLLGVFPLSFQAIAFISIFYVAILRICIVLREGLSCLKPPKNTQEASRKTSETNLPA